MAFNHDSFHGSRIHQNCQFMGPLGTIITKLQVQNYSCPHGNPTSMAAATNEMNAFSLMLYAQFGVIATIATWFLPDEISEIGIATSVLVVGFLGIGFLQLLQVKNGVS